VLMQGVLEPVVALAKVGSRFAHGNEIMKATQALSC